MSANDEWLSCYRAPDANTRASWSGRDDGAAVDEQRWHQAIRLIDLREDPEHCFEPTIAFIGYASDLGVRANQGRAGAAEGPARLRARMASLPMINNLVLLDCGDIVARDSVLETQEALAVAVERIVRSGALVFVLGGGHDQAFGHFLGVARGRGTPPACVNFDAHLDLRPMPASGPNSGTPYTQAWDWCRLHSAPFRYVALGVQRLGNTELMFTRAQHAAASIVDADGFALDMLDVVMEAVNDSIDDAEICVSIDLDVFAAAFAPGVSAPTAMGIAPDAAFRRVLRGLLDSRRVRGVEIAELCPPLDIDDRTARLGASIAYEIALTIATIPDDDADEDDDNDESEGDIDGDERNDDGDDQSPEHRRGVDE